MITTFYPPYNFGGDGLSVARLVRALASDGHQVHVVHDSDAYRLAGFGEPPDAPAEPENVTVHTLRRKSRASLGLLASHQLGRPVGMHREILRIIEGNAFDVIHYHNVSLMGGPRLLQYGKAIKLCTLHDHWFVCAMHVLWRYNREACTKRTCLRCTLAGGRPPQLWRYTGAVRRAVRSVDAFLSCSEFSRDAHIRNGFPAPIRHLTPFIADGFDNPPADLTRKPPHHRPYFLYVGRLEILKGVQVLIDLFRRYNRADLLIAGAGSYEGDLRRMAAGLQNVDFLGRVAHQDLARYYTHARAALVPSLCYETFGAVVVEAFAMRTPVIAHDLGALPEVIRSGGGGFTYRSVVELEDAMNKLLTDDDLRARLGEEGYNSYRDRYTQERHMNAYYSLIQEIAAGKRSR